MGGWYPVTEKGHETLEIKEEHGDQEGARLAFFRLTHSQGQTGIPKRILLGPSTDSPFNDSALPSLNIPVLATKLPQFLKGTTPKLQQPRSVSGAHPPCSNTTQRP